MSSSPSSGSAVRATDDGELTPEEEDLFRVGLEVLTQEKIEALRNPGPTWREWFYYDISKVWVGLGFFVVDAWIAASWVTGGTVSSGDVVGLVLSLVAAIYLEVLLYRYLWRRPSEGLSSSGRRFRPGWTALREVGRWTPEAAQLRERGRRAPIDDGAPNPDEFL